MAKKKNNNGGGGGGGASGEGGGGGGGGGGEDGGDKSNDTTTSTNTNANKNTKNEVNIVLKLNLHCEACKARITKSILSFPGVQRVELEGEDKAKVVAGPQVEVQKLREKVEKKTQKKVEIVSPLPKKDNQTPNHQNKQKDKQVPEVTVVLKVSWHCFGCGDRIHKIVSSFKGVYEVTIDKDKDEVKLTGRIETKKLVEELREKMKRPVEILPEKKEKDKKAGGGGGSGGGGGGDKAGQDGSGGRVDKIVAAPPQGCNWHGIEFGYDPYYVPEGPQIFSDENPNACSIM